MGRPARCIYIRHESQPRTEQASAPGKRQNFGEEIPGSRRDQAQRASRVLDELAAMEGDASELSTSQIQAKLTEIRRDDIWGSLDERLSQLQSQGASPSLALAWRVLYRGVAASAASMDLKPTHGRYYILSPHQGYIFGLCYEAALKGIAADMEGFPLDATWPEINDIGFSQESNRSYLDGPMLIDKIQTYLEANGDLSPQDGAAAWLRSGPANSGTKYLISLVRKQGIRASDPPHQGPHRGVRRIRSALERLGLRGNGGTRRRLPGCFAPAQLIEQHDHGRLSLRHRSGRGGSRRHREPFRYPRPRRR